MKIDKLFSQGLKMAQLHSPEILTALGISGVVTTAYLTAKSTVKAVHKIRGEEAVRLYDSIEVGKPTNEQTPPDPLTKREVVELVWTEYIPPVLVGTATVGAIFGAHKASARRTAAAVAAYSLTRDAFQEYKDEVKGMVGEKKASEVEQAVVEQRVNTTPIPDQVPDDKGDTWFFDMSTARYFKHDIEAVKKAEVEVNRRLFKERYVSIKEFYSILGIWHGDTMERLGWEVPEPMELIFTPVLHQDTGVPCIGITYSYIKGL